MAKKDGKTQLSKKRKILIIVGVVVLVVLAGGAGIAVRWWQDASRQADETSEVDDEEPTLPPVVDDLQNLRNQGDNTAFDEEIEAALANPDYDDSTRALIYIQQGNAAYDSQDYNAALEAYLQAEDLVRTSETAQLVGFAYEELGDASKAIEYYNLTIERLSPENILYESDKAYFEERINNLQG